MSKAATRRRNRKRTLYIAQGGLCWLCGEKMDLYFGPGRPPPRAASFDHVTPKSLGGSSAMDNLMLAHAQCNWVRGNRQEVRAIDLSSGACRHGCQTACFHDEVAGLL